MIDEILKHGGQKHHLAAKIFGGGRMMNSLSDVGAKNFAFVREYLKVEGIPLCSEDVGDVYPRKLIFSDDRQGADEAYQAAA